MSRQPVRLVIATVALMALGACTNSPAPDDPVTESPIRFGVTTPPGIIWPEGEPEDELDAESQFAVDLLREWDTRANITRATLDFSDQRLHSMGQGNTNDSLERSLRNGWQQAYARETSRLYPAGPTPMVIQSTKTEGGIQIITACGAWGIGWLTNSAPSRADEAWRDNGTVSTFIVDSANETILNEDKTDEPCSLDRARAGYFDPAPAYGEPIEFSSIRNLDGRSITVEEWREYIGASTPESA